MNDFNDFFDLLSLNPHRTETSSSDAATVTGDARWSVPWRTQLRETVRLVWASGWAALWSDWLWWRHACSVGVGWHHVFRVGVGA